MAGRSKAEILSAIKAAFENRQLPDLESGAMDYMMSAAAKPARRNPREIAVQVVERLAGDPRLASVEIAGPGFINLRVSDAALIARTLTRLEQVLNTEIDNELRGQRQQTEPKAVRAVGN